MATMRGEGTDGGLPRWVAARTVRLPLVLLAAGLVLIAPLSPNAYAMRLLQSLAVVGIAAAATGRWRRGEGPGWGLVAVAGLGWVLTLGVGWYSEVIDSSTWHLGARWLFTASALVALVGLSWVLSTDDRRRNLIQAFDAVVVVTSCGVVLSVALDGAIDGARLAATMHLPFLGPLTTLCMAAGAVSCAMSQPSRRLPRWLALGFAVAGAGDLCQMVQVSGGVSATHNAYTPLLAAGAVLLLVAMLTPDRPVPTADLMPPLRQAVLAGLVMVALVVGGADLLRNEAYRPVALVAGGLMVASQTVALLLAMSDLRRHTVAAEDVSDRLRRSEQRLQMAIEATPVGIGLAETDTRIVTVNRAMCKMLGLPAGAIVGRPWSDFIDEHHDADPSALGPGGTPLRRLRRADGTTRLVEVTSRHYPSPDGDRLWLGMAVDVTDRVADLRQLEHNATHDELTDLPNRRAFSARLAEQLAEGETGVLVVCDLDQFKFVNDTLGHSVGDALLIALADRFGRLSRAGCEVARIGGDEFCVLVPAGHAEPLELVAEQFRRPFELGDGEVLHATASIGGTLIRPGADPEVLVAEADAAMYRAKAAGPGRREMYSASTGRSMHEQRRTTAGLHRALGADEFEVWFQPIADVAHGTIVGQESLVRWRDPQRGLLAPGDFVDVAEQCGLISGIGERVLRRALEAAGEGYWSHSGAYVSVNVSAVQITDGHFVSTVARELDRSGFDPGRLWLEITESALLTDERAARRACQGLRDLGVHLAIDDFGTGYGSLTYLVEFPVEAIKIDRAFVAGLHRRPTTSPVPWVGGPAESSRDLAIISALIGLAARLGLSCVAEGVESDSQLRRLRRLGCPLVQGFLVGEPAPVPDFPVVGVVDLAVEAADAGAARLAAERGPLQDRPGSVS